MDRTRPASTTSVRFAIKLFASPTFPTRSTTPSSRRSSPPTRNLGRPLPSRDTAILYSEEALRAAALQAVRAASAERVIRHGRRARLLCRGGGSPSGRTHTGVQSRQSLVISEKNDNNLPFCPRSFPAPEVPPLRRHGACPLRHHQARLVRQTLWSSASPRASVKCSGTA